MFLLVAPGLVLPGGIEFRACFCGGVIGGCCHGFLNAGPHACAQPCCEHARTANTSVPTLESDRRCSGCFALVVPRGKPVRVVVPEQASMTPVGDVVLDSPVPKPVDTPAHRLWLDPWHAPPIQRLLPLVI
jgi:hypothetical protein